MPVESSGANREKEALVKLKSVADLLLQRAIDGTMAVDQEHGMKRVRIEPPEEDEPMMEVDDSGHTEESMDAGMEVGYCC